MMLNHEHIGEETELLKLHSLSSPATAQNPHKSPSQFLSSQLSGRGRVFSTNTFGFAPSPSSSTKRLSLKCRQSEYFDQQRTSTAASPNKPSPASQTPAGGTYSVLGLFYPVLLQAEWDKYLFIATVLSLIVYPLRYEHLMTDIDEGKIRKVLKVEPLPDGSGHFFNLSVQNKLINLDESIYIPITRAEFAVLKSAFNFILPYILGWHAYANSIKPEASGRANNSGIKYGGDFEWSR
ncbi:single-stranded DNA-binding protein WHY1, chloroplastic-like [Pyrus communis]|uniref:single-stranded DNA-binding protein WHY1, chloroplastic-like n=1 Tax=Pyrus communis TaxID=23211 RepID=UPI0035BF5978